MNGIIAAVLFFGGIGMCAAEDDWAGAIMGLIGVAVFAWLGAWR